MEADRQELLEAIAMCMGVSSNGLATARRCSPIAHKFLFEMTSMFVARRTLFDKMMAAHLDVVKAALVGVSKDATRVQANTDLSNLAIIAREANRSSRDVVGRSWLAYAFHDTGWSPLP